MTEQEFRELIEDVAMTEEEKNELVEAIQFNQAALDDEYNQIVQMNTPRGCHHGKCNA